MDAMQSPGVYVRTVRPERRLDGVATDVAGFVGIAERGPVDSPVRIDGWPAFVSVFGSFVANGFLAYAVRAFFEAGGRACWVVRVAAPSVATRTAGAQPADGSASVVASAAGFAAGAVATLTQQTATASAGAQPADRLSSRVADARGFPAGALVRLSQNGKARGFATVRAQDVPGGRIIWRAPLAAELDLGQGFTLAARTTDRRIVASLAGTTIGWDLPLDGRFDLSLPIDVAAGAATASGLIHDASGEPALEIRANSPGAWGEGIGVRLTRQRADAVMTRKAAAGYGPTSLPMSRLDRLAAGATVEIRQGALSAIREIASLDAGAATVRLHAPLPAGFDLAGAASGASPMAVVRLCFSLAVWRDGRLQELHREIDRPSAATPEASPVNAASRLIAIRRAGAGNALWPDPASPALEAGMLRLEGGRDGVAMLRRIDLTGSGLEPGRRGLAAYEAVDEPAIMAIPDALIERTPPRREAPRPPRPVDPCDLCPPPDTGAAPKPVARIVEAAPSFTPEEARAVQEALVRHCEARMDRVALLDVPRDPAAPDPHAIAAALDWRSPWDTSFAAAYYPWVQVVDPLGGVRALPPSGHAAGIVSASEGRSGPQAAPANAELRWIAALGRPVDQAAQELLNPVGVNCLRGFGGRGLRLYGARTLSRTVAWRYLNVRRIAIRLRRTLAFGLAWVPFEPNDMRLASRVVAAVEGLLEEEWRAGRLAGSVAGEAFFVAAPRAQEMIDNGRFELEIGFAPVIPAEFVLLLLKRTEDRLDVAELTTPWEAET